MAKTRPNSTLKEATNLKSKKKNKKSASKKLLSGNLAMAMKNKPLKDNPFETIWSRKKFHVLGKKSKGEERRTGLARSRAMDKRKNTLLKEYEQSGKSSMFVDKRIGEQNESLGEFDKAILRSQRELKVKMTRKSKYNLSDDEEDDGEIYGSGPFSERDDFEEELPPDEDADEIKKTPLLKHVNGHDMDDQEQTGITDGVEYRHKSKKEVMEEIILKSKFFKAQKSKEKEENEELVEQLDKDFSSLVQSEALLSLTQPGKMSALKALVNMGSSKELPKKAEETATPRKEYSNQIFSCSAVKKGV